MSLVLSSKLLLPFAAAVVTKRNWATAVANGTKIFTRALMVFYIPQAETHSVHSHHHPQDANMKTIYNWIQIN